MCLSKASVRNTVSKCLFSRALAGLRWASGMSNGNELTLNMSNKAAVSTWPAQTSFWELNDFLAECWRLLYCLRRAQRPTTDAQTLLCVCVFCSGGESGFALCSAVLHLRRTRSRAFWRFGWDKTISFSVLKHHLKK